MNFKYIICLSLLALCILTAIEDPSQRRHRRRRDNIIRDEQNQEEFMETIEEKRQRERDRARQKLKKPDSEQGFNAPPGFQKFNQRDVRDYDNMFEKDQNKKETREERQRRQRLEQELKEDIEWKNQERDQQQAEMAKKRKDREQRKAQQRERNRRAQDNGETEEEKRDRKAAEQALMDEEMEEIKLQMESQVKQDQIKLEQIKKEAEIHKNENLSWLEEWEELMTDFQADEILTFELPGRGTEVFLEDVKKPCNLRGAFFTSFESQKKIEFYIEAPNNKRIYAKTDKQGIFSIDLSEEHEMGTYQFIFNNKRQTDSKQISFAIDVTNNEEFLQTQDINTIEDNTKDIHVELKDVLRQTKFQKKKMDSQLKYTKKVHKRLFVFTILETIFIVGCAVWQTWYIKRILDNRNIV